jgi:hypothetical protein
VAKRSGPGGLGFRLGATETGLAWVGTIGHWAWRGWHGVDVTVPCRFGCGATRVCTRACWNAMPALGAPGGSLASAGMVGGALHGRARGETSSGNWSRGSRRVWRRGDGPGGGRWHAAHAGVPTVATVTPRAAWGAGAVSLRAGVGHGVLAGR